MPDVTLTIKVKDGEVTAATKNVQNLDKAAQNVGKSNVTVGAFGGKKPEETLEQQRRLAAFMGKDLPKAAEEATAAVSKTASATEELGSGAQAVAASGPSLLAVIGVVGAVAAGMVVAAASVALVAHEIIKLAQEFADYALDVGKAAEETGLATETISALKYEAAATGRSFSDLSGPINNFRKLIGEAAAGSDDAKKKLQSLGIDGSKAIYDIDGAFRVAVANIVKAPAGIEQVRQAFNAFGDDGYKLIPFLKEFHGNVDEAVNKARELGLAVSGPDVAAAKEFNRAYEDLKKVVLGITYTFGREFLPGVTKALKEVGDWVMSNKDTIKEWATSVGGWVSWLVDHWTTFKSIVESVANSMAYVTRIPLPEVTRSQTAGPATLPNYDPNLNPQGTPQGPDPAALEAARAEMARKEQEAIERSKKDWDAAIESWKLYGQEAGKSLSETYAKLREQFDASGDAKSFTANVTAALKQYVDQVETAESRVVQLENEKARRDKATSNELTVLHQQQAARRQAQDALGEKIAKEGMAAVAAQTKKLTADQLREAEEAMRKRIELSEQRDAFDMENHAYALQTMQIDDQQYLDFQKKYALEALEYRKKQLQDFLSKYSLDAKKRAEIEGDIGKLSEEIAQQRLRNERALTAEAAARAEVIREIKRLEQENADPVKTATRRGDLAKGDELQLKRQIQSLNDAIANAGINDSLVIEEEHLRDILDLRNRELDAVIRVNRAQLELAHSMEISNNQIRASVYEHMAAASNLNDAISRGINNTFDAISGQMDKQLDKLNNWSHGMLSFITEPLKAMSHKALSTVFSGVIDAIFPGMDLGKSLTKTNNPVAAPIVDKLDEIHSTLKGMAAANGFAGTSIPGVGGSGGGGLIGQVLHALHLGGASPSGGSNPGIFSSTPGSTGSIDASGNYVVNGSQAAGGLGSLFSGASLATMLTQAGPAALAGLFISSLSEKSPLKGALKGGLVGFLAGLFNRTKLRRQEETIRNQAMLDAQSAINQQFADLETQARQGNIDPSSVVNQGNAIGQQVRAQYLQMANSLTDKKTRNIALKDVSRIDQLIAQKIEELKAVAERAQSASDVSKRILPEFAGGTYFADYFRPNGLLPGMFDGKDNILAMISRGEMVLNPQQQHNVRALAGGDVFAHAGIPNYPKASLSSKLAGGGVAGSGLALSTVPANVTVNPQFTLHLEGVTFDQGAKAWVESDDGRRIVVNMLTRETGLKSK